MKTKDPEREEVVRLANDLKNARGRSEAAIRLAQTVTETVHVLAEDMAEAALKAYESAESLEVLVSKIARVQRELRYVLSMEDLDVGAARLLQQQLRDVMQELDFKIETSVDDDLHGQVAQGQAERRETEDTRRKAEDLVRREEDARRRDE